MKTFYVLFCIFSISVIGSSIPKRNGKFSPKISNINVVNRIIGGSQISIKEAPYYAQVEWEHQFYCSAAIVNKNHVVTIATVVAYGDPEEFAIRVGSDRIEVNGTVHNVTQIRVHELFEGGDLYNVALMTVSPDFEFNEVTQSIPLAEEEPVPDKNGTVAGIGVSTDNPPVLRSTTMNIVDRDTCIVYPEITEICGINKQGVPCYGDEGGPFVIDGKLAGVTAYSYCTPDMPTTFTNIAFLKEWIENNINN